MSCYRCYRCYRSIHWSDMFSSNLRTDLFQSQLRSFLRPCWGHIEVIFHEMNQPAIWGSPIFPDLSIKFLMSRLQRPVQTTAGSDVQSGHLQVAEVRWHRHWDKTPKEHKKKTGFSLISGCWFIRYTLGFDPQWRTQTMARGLGPNRSRWARQTLGIRWPYEIRNNTTTWMVDPMVKTEWNMPRIVEKCWKNGGKLSSLIWHQMMILMMLVNKTCYIKKKQGGPENPKARRRTARLFWKCCGVGSCALDEIDVRSSLKHRAHWWYHGPQFTTACCVSYVYILPVAIAANELYPIFLVAIYIFLDSRLVLVCFAAEGARTKRGRTEHRAKQNQEK